MEPSFILLTLALCLLSRGCSVFPLAALANMARSRSHRIKMHEQAVIWFSGLRGAIAFALAHNVHSDHQPTIAAATTTVVMATVFILGGATRTVLRQLNMEANDDGPPGVHREGAAPHAVPPGAPTARSYL
mgnify:CR=1 FL=1